MMHKYCMRHQCQIAEATRNSRAATVKKTTHQSVSVGLVMQARCDVPC